MTTGSRTQRQEKLDIPTLLNREKANMDSKLNQYKSSVPTHNLHSSTSNERNPLASPNGSNMQFSYPVSSGLLTSRNSEVAKSTANLILKPKQEEKEDLFSNLGKSNNKYLDNHQSNTASNSYNQNAKESYN